MCKEDSRGVYVIWDLRNGTVSSFRETLDRSGKTDRNQGVNEWNLKRESITDYRKSRDVCDVPNTGGTQTIMIREKHVVVE